MCKDKPKELLVSYEIAPTAMGELGHQPVATKVIRKRAPSAPSVGGDNLWRKGITAIEFHHHMPPFVDRYDHLVW
jgi:hypothetical protein